MGDYSKQLYDIEDALGCQKTKLWDKRLNPVILLVKCSDHFFDVMMELLRTFCEGF